MRRCQRWRTGILTALLSILLAISAGISQAQSPEEFEALKKRVEKLESAVFPAETMNWLEARGDRLYDGAQEYRAWSVNIVGYAIAASSPQQVDACLDNLAVNNVRMVRILHLDSRVGSGTPMWFSDETTMVYNESVLKALDYFIEACRKRRIRVWLNLAHRRILTDRDGPETPFGKIDLWDKLNGPRPGGLRKGEIRSLAYFDPVLEALLLDHARKLMNRVNTVNGIRYKEDPTIAVLTWINEATATRPETAYFMGDRSGLDTNSFKRATFRLWDEFNARATGTPDNPAGTLKGSKQDLQKFYADVEYQFNKRNFAAMRADGVKALLNGTAFYGQSTMPQICSQAAANIIDGHIYPETAEVPDVLDPQTAAQHSARCYGSIVAASRLLGKPLAVTEWGSVYQQGPLARTKSGSWLSGPAYVAKASAAQGVSIAVQYAWQSHILGGPTANNEVYDSGRDPDFVVNFTKAGNPFRESKPLQMVLEVKPTVEDLFGAGDGPAFAVPLIGSQKWAIENADSQITQFRLPEVKELPWLK